MVREEVLTFSEAPNTRYVTYNLAGADLMIKSVVISQELKAVFGPLLILPAFTSEVEIINKPLSIEFLIFVKQGEVALDLDSISAVINEADTNLPIIKKEIENIIHHKTRRSESTWEPTFGSKILPTKSSPYSFKLTFDIPRQEVKSLRLSFGNLTVNGKKAIVNPLVFERLFRTIGR